MTGLPRREQEFISSLAGASVPERDSRVFS